MKTEQSGRRLDGLAVWVMAKGYAPDEGGMQTYAAGVARAYARLGAAVTVFTQTSAGPRRVAIGGVDVVDVGPVGGGRVLTRLVGALRRERRGRGDPTFVHGTTWRTSIVPMLLGLRYLTTFHGREFMGQGMVAAALMRLAARRADTTISVSRYTADRLREQLGEQMSPVIAYNGGGIAGAAASPQQRNSDTPLLYSLCRLEPRKNIGACVKACAQLKAAGRSFRYVIAGRGPEMDRLRQLVADLHLENEIELRGFVSDDAAARLYADADIFLHPQVAIQNGQDFEGFGITVLDAMCSGCAVVVGQEGGTAELVESGVSGVVVDGNDVAALTKAIDGLLADADRRIRIGAAAERRARDTFSWDRHVDVVLDASGITGGIV